MQISDERAAIRSISAWCSALGVVPLASSEECARQAEMIGKRARQITRGQSTEGRPILALRFGPDEPGGLVAWGYPHPDEPLGATALLALALALADGDVPEQLQGQAVTLVLCADPDQAERNISWVQDPSLASYLQGRYRPMLADRDVDYMFPVDCASHFQGATSMAGLAPPMPESVFLADLIRRQRPRVVGLMHAATLLGDFTFLSHRPDLRWVEGYVRLLEGLGRIPHSGVIGDTENLLADGRCDLLGEQTLNDRLMAFERRFGAVSDEQRLAGCVSAAMYCETLDPRPLVITPEAAQFVHPALGRSGSSGVPLVDLVCSEHERRQALRHRTRNPALTARIQAIEAAAVADLREEDPWRQVIATEAQQADIQLRGALELACETQDPQVIAAAVEYLDSAGVRVADTRSAVTSQLARLLYACASRW